MEQKKTLWIIAAVGLFLLVVLGAAMILYPPSARYTPAVASINPVERKTEVSYVAPKTEEIPVSQGFEKLPESDSQNAAKEANTLRINDLFVVSENTSVFNTEKTEDNGATTIDLNALRTELQTQTQPDVSNINITVNVPEQETKIIEVSPKVEVSAITSESKAQANQVKSEAKPEKVKKDVKKEASNTKNVKTTAKNTSTSSSESAKTTEVKTPAPKPVTRYWVQVAAYSNKKTAENARTILDNNKIPSDIFTYQDNKNRLFYRVRVGPYTTKSEAEYWKSKIEKIPDFAKAQSYVASSVD